jgi:mRNA interferase MazF
VRHSSPATGRARAVLTLPESGSRITAATPDVVEAIRDADDDPVAPAGRVVLASAPKIRAVYWCRFWRDALRPEFYKNRPVVVVSRDNRLDGPALVVPLTTKPQGNNKWAYKLTENPNPGKPTIESWAVCNHIYAVSCARLAQMDGGVPRMKPQDFDEVVRLMLRALPDAPSSRALSD